MQNNMTSILVIVQFSTVVTFYLLFILLFPCSLRVWTLHDRVFFTPPSFTFSFWRVDSPTLLPKLPCDYVSVSKLKCKKAQNKLSAKALGLMANAGKKIKVMANISVMVFLVGI